MRPLRLFDHVCTRLQRGPASTQSLARWCDVSIGFMHALLEGALYALPRNPLSPAARITVGRGARWPRTVSRTAA